MRKKILFPKKIRLIETLVFTVFGLFFGINTAFALPGVTVINSDFLDLDSDGTVDSIDLTLSEDVTDCDFEASDWTVSVPGSIGISAITAVTCDAALLNPDSPMLYLTVDASSSITGGSVLPSISYTNQGTSDDIVTISGPLAGLTDVEIADAAPALIRDVYSDFDGKVGPGDTVNVYVEFTEFVNVPGNLSIDFNNLVSKNSGPIMTFSNTIDFIETRSYTVGVTGSGEDVNPLSVSSFTGTVFDLYGNNTDHPAIPIGENLDDYNTIEVDTTEPSISWICINATGDTGTLGVFKYLDTPVFEWDNSLACDNNSDVASVYIDASSFRSVDSVLPAVDVGSGIYQSTLTGLMDSQDEGFNNLTITAIDDVGNMATVTGMNDFEIDTILPEFALSGAVQVLKQDGSDPANETNMWYYYPGNSIKANIFNELEEDGKDLVESRICVKPLVLDDPNESCDELSDFENSDYYSTLSVLDDTQSQSDFGLSGLGAYPTEQGAFPLSFWLKDDAGNVNMSMAQDEMLIAIFNINPKDMITELGNPTTSGFDTTDWSTIEDFTFIPADDLIFNINNGTYDIARLIFKDDINLCDMTTVNGLAELGSNFVANSDLIRVDSSALPRLDKAAQLMFKVNSTEQPGFVVKDNSGQAIGTISNDADFADIINFTPADYGYASNFNWDGINQEMTFEVSGFSEYDTDFTAPTVTYSPLNGASSVAVNAPIVLTFSEEMDTSSFTYTVTPNPGSLSVVWSSGDTVATISHANFANGTSYSVAITAATDMVGNSLALPSSVTFSSVASSGGGGGGGGGSSFIIGATSTSGTGTPTAISSTVTGTRTLERSIDLNDSMLEEVDVDGESMIQANVTGESGQITLGNDDMTLYIGPNTTVMADANWNGVIAPPSIVSLEKVLSGDKLNVVDGQDVPAEKIDFVLKIGSDNSKLQFSPAVKVEIPVDLPNGTVVQIFVSNDGSEFETLQTVTVVDGKLVFETSHLSYFAFATEMNMEIFPDLEGHWAKEFVMSLYNDGIVNGKADGNFEPDKYITRAELTKIALLGYEYSVSAVNGMPFSDVATDSWYAGFVATAKENSIVSGFAGNLFKPNTNITRAEALKILAKAGGLDPTLTGGVSEFSDVPSDAWYYDYVRMAVGMGVVNGYGDGTFRPNAYITRAEASKILVKFLEMQ